MSAFDDIPRKSLPQQTGKIAGSDYFDRVAAFQIGEGSKVLRADQSGLWLGASTFADAPFSVDMEGNAVGNSMTISGYILVGGAAADVNAGAVTIAGGKITANTITATQIAGNTITASQIAAGTITATQIASGTITGNEIAGNTITASKIAATTITASEIAANTITTTQINYVSGTKLDAASVSGSKIVTNPNFSGYVMTFNLYAAGISVGVPASTTGGIMLSAGKEVWWSGGEGNIRHVDQILGYNDLRLYSHSSGEKIGFWCEAGGGELYMYPYTGNFYATGTKFFRIPHPDDPDNSWIRYSSIESPEVALKIRGKAKLIKGEVVINLPRHWELVTEEYLTTVQLTPMEDCNGLFTIKDELKHNKFKAKELNGGVSSAEFMWELTAIRKGYKDFDPEQTIKDEIEEHAVALVEIQKETKEEWLARRKKSKDILMERQQKIHKKYKEITGKDYVDNLRKWEKELLEEKELEEEVMEKLRRRGEIETSPKN